MNATQKQERPWNQPDRQFEVPEVTPESAEASRRKFEQALAEQDQPEPIRIIRKVNGRHQWVDVRQDELTPDELREMYVRSFSPCGL